MVFAQPIDQRLAAEIEIVGLQFAGMDLLLLRLPGAVGDLHLLVPAAELIVHGVAAGAEAIELMNRFLQGRACGGQVGRGPQLSL